MLLLLVFFTSITWSQNYKFGKVSKTELEEKFYPLDSTANATVLYSERKTTFEFSKEKGFQIFEKYYLRLKIYNPEGYYKATKEIKIFHNQHGKEKVIGVKAKTYNLEDGKIVISKLKKENIFKEEKDKHSDIEKFTMPNLKPRCIVEWKYTKTTPFIGNLDKIEIQDDIPVKKIIVKITTPEYFNYNTLKKGFIQIPIETDQKQRTIAITSFKREGGFRNPIQSKNQTSEFTFDEKIQLIEMTHIPALEDEPFSANINNYKSGINHELSYINYPNEPIEMYANDWEAVVKKIYNNASFGKQLKKNKHFEKDLLSLLQNVKSTGAKITAIFQFVKNKIKWNGYKNYYSDEGVRKAYKEGVGNVADINLNLVAMLQSVGFDANPVLVSTVDNGIPLFPTRYGFNYVIARVVTPKGYVLLDATDKNAVPNVLPERVLNFRGLVVRNNGNSAWIELFPQEHSVEKTIIGAKFNEDGFTGTARKTITNNFLLDYRNAARDKSKESLIEWIDEKTEGVEVINARVSNLDDLDKDGIENIQFETESFYEDIADKTYISPLLYLQMKENVFKSEKREFPIFYNTPWAEIISININIPDSYTIENVPENAEYLLPNDLGGFQYSIIPKGNAIEIKSKLIINQPVLTPANYQDLKEFYNKIISKQREKIVLSKN